jgi:hypothetical protein
MEDRKAPEDDNEESEEFIEISWEPLEAALDAMIESGLDLSDTESALHHVGALLAVLLRKIDEEQEVDEDEIANLAAEVASFAVDLALSDEELPSIESSDGEEN